MDFKLKGNLPFTQIKISHQGNEIELLDILIDTGSSSTILSIDALNLLHIIPEPSDTLHFIRGVGGTEVVFARTIDVVAIAEKSISDFKVEIGEMNYGFEINGILGMDYLLRTKATIDLENLKLRFA